MLKPLTGVQKGVLVVLTAVVLVAAVVVACERTRPVSSARVPPPARVAPPAAGDLRVQVEGEVLHPGVYALPAGARVTDALEAAGGLLPSADRRPLHLARVLRNGEKITVRPVLPASVTPSPRRATRPSAAASTPLASAARSSSASAREALPLSLNQATAAELEDLPGVGPALAAEILRYRAQHPFVRAEELMLIRGISPRDFEKLRSRVRP